MRVGGPHLSSAGNPIRFSSSVTSSSRVVLPTDDRDAVLKTPFTPGRVTAFSYHRAGSLDEALTLLATPGHVAIGGGTDLLVTIEERLAAPQVVVDVRGVAESQGVTPTADGGLRIGAAMRLADIAAHPLVRDRYPAVALACELVGTPAIREMATLGGNLCQRPRCWYFRRGVPCLKNGGDHCPARDGENQYHAILEGGPCYIVHPSDPAVALVALDATIELAGPRGRR